MARPDFRTPRLYVPAPLAEGAELTLDPPDATSDRAGDPMTLKAAKPLPASD